MALPNYEVEFIPLERRLSDRRVGDAPLPPGVNADRRQSRGRRASDPERRRAQVLPHRRPATPSQP